MNLKTILFLQLLSILYACNPKADKVKEYPRWIGDIAYDKVKDKADFKIYNGEEKIKQYFNFNKGLLYKGEKTALIDSFKNLYQAPDNNTESGMLRVRFIVNAKGKTDRFRTIGSDFNYQEQSFSAEITDQITDICKRLDQWGAQPNIEKTQDYYQYLIFKIKNGQIIEILP